MILGSSELFKLITENNLITGIDDYEFKIEGATVDVRLDKVYIQDGGGTLSVDSRNTGKVEELLPYDNKLYPIYPGSSYLVTTLETVNMPTDLIGHIDTRTTMFRSGLSLKATYINPGYCGVLSFMITNQTPSVIHIEHGFRIAQIVFHEIKGTCEPYNGYWQGGKVHTEGTDAVPR